MIKEKYYTDADVEVLKALFVDDQEFLYLFRKLCFETVTKTEASTLRKKLKNVPRELLTRLFVPTVSASNPIGQHRDLMMDQLQIDSVLPELITIQIDARGIMSTFFSERLSFLFDEADIVTELSELVQGDTPEERVANIKARSLIVSYVDNVPVMIRRITEGSANLSTEEITKRQAQNSNK